MTPGYGTQRSLALDEVAGGVAAVLLAMVVFPVSVLIVSAVVTTVLGWWKPAIHEPRRVGGGWMWSVPVLLLLGALINLATTKWGEIDHVGAYVGWLALGTVFVGLDRKSVV